MLELNVELGERSYPIYIDSGLLNDTFWHKAIKGSRVLIVTNDVVAPLYLNGVKDQLHNFEVDAFILKDGEAQKSFENFEKINTHLLEQRHGRDTTLVALGGGVVGDLTGFVAACYQRGVNFIQLPTTLLSQVDSSVGGKTAINHPLGKNMIGAFYQPQSVVIDIDTLKTLPPREFAAGMAEVIKYGIIYDGDFFSWLEQNQSDLVGQKSEALSYVIHRCCQIKAEIVAQDEKEAGLRALLNLGHTFGHAIEAEMGYGQWLHGEAVAAGIVLASQVAVNKNWLDATDFRRIVTLLQAFSLPVEAPDSMSVDVFWNHMAIDKKVKAGKVRFVIPTAIGKSELTDNVSKQEVAHILAN